MLLWFLYVASGWFIPLLIPRGVTTVNTSLSILMFLVTLNTCNHVRASRQSACVFWDSVSYSHILESVNNSSESSSTTDFSSRLTEITQFKKCFNWSIVLLVINAWSPAPVLANCNTHSTDLFCFHSVEYMHSSLYPHQHYGRWRGKSPERRVCLLGACCTALSSSALFHPLLSWN